MTKPKPTIPVVARITSPAGAHTYRAAGLGEEPIYEILNRMPVTAEPASVARERTCPADAR